MRLTLALALAVLPLSLAACGPDGPSKGDTGMVVGAATGGILGNVVGRGGQGKILSTVAGAFIGGVVGSEIGKSMDKQDRILAQQAELAALERGRSGERTAWKNPDNGRYGEVIPLEPYRRGQQDCRDYTHKIFIDGRPQAMRGTACRNPDGTWSNVS
jgi:surface antigen